MNAEASAGERVWVAPLVAGLIVLVIGLALVDTLPVGVLFDDGMYVILAKSLATGQGLRWLQLPGAPAATHFPPGYPAVLALLWKLYPRFPANVVLFKIANAIFLAAAGGGVALFARRRLALPAWAAAVVAVVATAGLPTLMLSTQVMSEPLFLALLLPVLLAAEQVAEGDGGWVRVALLGVAVGCLTLVRTQGVAVAGGVVIVLAGRREVQRAALFAAVTLAVMLPWQLWAHAHATPIAATLGGNYQPYTTWLVDGFRQLGPSLLWRTAAGTLRELGHMVALFGAPVMPAPVQTAAMLVIVALSVLGWRRLRRVAPVTAVFVVLYLMMVVFWPFTPTRFVWGIWPVLFVLPVLGSLEIAAWRPPAPARRGLRVAALCAAYLVAAGYARYTARAYSGRWWSTISRASAGAFRPLVLWTRANSSPSAVIASVIEPVVYLYGGRQGVPAARFTVRDYFRPPTAAESATDLRAILAAYHVDAIAVIARDSLHAALEAMASESAPEVVRRDSLPNGLIYTPSFR